MPGHSHVAFLRGINLGRRRVKMEHLRHLFEDAGFGNVSTYIASGNVIFTSAVKDESKVVATIEDHLEDGLGYQVGTFVRTKSELDAIAALRPFGEDEQQSVQVTFLRKALCRKVARKLEFCSTDADSFCVHQREIFWRCRTGISKSSIWKSPELKSLNLPEGTMRNLRTLRKIAAKTA